jgi:hypothetical protein
LRYVRKNSGGLVRGRGRPPKPKKIKLINSTNKRRDFQNTTETCLMIKNYLLIAATLSDNTKAAETSLVALPPTSLLTKA